MTWLLLLAPLVAGAQPDMGLHQAALAGNLEAVQSHIRSGADLDAPDPYGSTPLAIAITFDRTDVARTLIEAGASLDSRNGEGSTPLHIAALFGRTELVGLLLDNGADRFSRDNASSTAYDLVAATFDDDVWLYDRIGAALAPLGLHLDYNRIRSSRPIIAEMLRSSAAELAAIDYAPLPSAEWSISTPADEGLDPALVADFFLDASHRESLYGALVIKNGRLIAERYFNEGSVDRKNRLQSVTKSFTSALVGIALREGCLKSPDQKMLEFFPEIADSVSDGRKRDITIRQMLQMRAGYPWEETDPVLWEGLLSGYYPPLIEDFPLVADPGTAFNYSNLTSNWLGIIVDRACGAHLKSYAQKYMFAPMGMDPGPWGTDAEGHNNGCADLHLTARDAAKLGLMYLNEGRYAGEQIVPAGWVGESLQRYSDNFTSAGIESGRVGRYFRDVGYGYQWWSATIGEHHVNLAWGHGGQFIILLHDLDMVVVLVSRPFYIQHDDEAWWHEKANLNLVGKFVASLPSD